MSTITVDIINPKAKKLLQELEVLNLISIRNCGDDGFLEIVKRMRAKAKKNTPTLAEITKEVEKVRSKRYGQTRK
ncbi:MAG: hypothetical protein IPP15_09030 [Saprospiraceae bacterium]|uniref:Uncharacterized protein n=1 Tax=Candidatus Opimibacter skivensis TaxID=2982028 RepID=A0A9D7XNU4_9BACT|nr:hypothetical protein [Candidatus Opimibacter skivensis]